MFERFWYKYNNGINAKESLMIWVTALYTLSKCLINKNVCIWSRSHDFGGADIINSLNFFSVTIWKVCKKWFWWQICTTIIKLWSNLLYLILKKCSKFVRYFENREQCWNIYASDITRHGICDVERDFL